MQTIFYLGMDVKASVYQVRRLVEDAEGNVLEDKVVREYHKLEIARNSVKELQLREDERDNE